MKKLIPLLFLCACSQDPNDYRAEAMSPGNGVEYTASCINNERVYIDETGHMTLVVNGAGEVITCGVNGETVLERERVGL
jgi:hypothetical protein